jgi:hypothetical protein
MKPENISKNFFGILYADGIVVGVVLTKMVSVPSTLRAIPSAQSTLYAEGNTVGV